jgi:hypothetical protein
MTRQLLSEQCRVTRLPAVRRPKVSIILHAGSAVPTARSITAIAPALAELQAEVVLVDRGRDPLTSLLPSLLRNLRCIYDRTAIKPCDAGIIGVGEARGDLLIFLDCDAVPPSAAAVIDVATSVAGAPRFAVGQRLLAPLRNLGMANIADDVTIRGGAAPLGLRMCVHRDLFMALGQFDTNLMDAPGLECADLFLKAMLTGARTEIWREPIRNSAFQPAALRSDAPVDTKRMLQALAAFRTRWQGAVHG